MTPYVIRQGDYTKKLAFTLGFDADEVWNAPENADLKAARPDREMLCPGDVLYLPDPKPAPVPVNGGSENAYAGNVPTIKVRVALLQDDVPLANEPFAVDGLPEPLSGTTAADGCVEFDAPITTREVSLVLPDKNLAYPVLIGDLDPPNERSGEVMRFTHIGCYGWFAELEAEFDPEHHQLAVATFQNMIGKDPTGTLDDATRQALFDKHKV